MRKTVEIEIKDRSEIRRFRITEMPATQGEVWFLKVVHLLTKANFAALVETIIKARAEAKKAGKTDEKDDPKDTFNMETLKSITAALSAVPMEDALPLWDELLGCCTRVDGGVDQVCSLSTVDGFIESPMTLMKLKMEAGKVCLGFLFEGGAFKFEEAASLLK